MDRMKLPSSVQCLMDQVNELAADHPQWAAVFSNCFSDTLLKAVEKKEDGTTYVLTGDIPAMWLRDSTAQIRPYLLLAKEDEEIGGLISGLVRRQFSYINIDPYANAFNETANGHGHQTDETEMGPWIWERKYEIDSLCYPIQLAYLLWKVSGRTDQFDVTFHSGVRKILDVWETERDHSQSPYRFERHDCVETDTLKDGIGSPVAVTGMLWSGFRPSDDCCRYHYLVPSNMFAAVVLAYLEEIYQDLFQDAKLTARARNLREGIENGIRQYAVVKNSRGEEVYAYEVDGLGGYTIMDDSNVPSLLAAPYLGYGSCKDPIYFNTRKTILSPENPYYYEGPYVKGIGSPHTPERYVWPIALSVQGLTAPDKKEKEELLNLLCRIDAGTLQMHEGVCADDPEKYTRPWFSWSNMMFCELLLDFYDIRIREIR